MHHDLHVAARLVFLDSFLRSNRDRVVAFEVEPDPSCAWTIGAVSFLDSWYQRGAAPVGPHVNGFSNSPSRLIDVSTMPDIDRAVTRLFVPREGGGWDYYPFGFAKPGYRADTALVEESLR